MLSSAHQTDLSFCLYDFNALTVHQKRNTHEATWAEESCLKALREKSLLAVFEPMVSAQVINQYATHWNDYLNYMNV